MTDERSKSDKGRDFEQSVGVALDLTYMDDLIIMSETDIRSHYPRITRVDFALIIRTDINRPLMICIQCKYSDIKTDSETTKSVINHATDLAHLMNCELVRVILLSKIQCRRREYLEAQYPSFINIYIENDMDISATDWLIRIIDTFLVKSATIPTELRPHQKEVVERFRTTTDSFIVCHPTGSGKTLTALHCVAWHREQYPEGTILWITKRIDVIRSQTMAFKYHRFVICPGAFTYDTVAQSYVTNTDQIISFSKTEKFQTLVNNTTLIIIDEVHGSAANKCHEMLSHFKCRKLGFSATPYNEKIKRNQLVNSLFPQGIRSCISFIRAVEENFILPPTIYMSTNSDVDFIMDVIRRSQTRYVLLWAGRNEKAEQWIHRLKSDDFVIYPYYDRYRSMFPVQPVIAPNKYHLLVCVGRCKEGFDYPAIDTAIDLDNRSINQSTFIQKLGRVVRHCPAVGKTRCAYYQRVESSDQDVNIGKIIRCFIGVTNYSIKNHTPRSETGSSHVSIGKVVDVYYDQIDFKKITESIHYPYEVLKSFGFRSIAHYREIAAENQRIPLHPNITYEEKGWEGWVKFLVDTNWHPLSEIKKMYKEIMYEKSIRHTYELGRDQFNNPRVPEYEAALEYYGTLNFLFKKPHL